MSDIDPDFADRISLLESLCAEIRQPQPGGARGPLAGRVLEAAGDLMRRSSSAEPRVDGWLRPLPKEDIESWLSTLSLDEISQRITRAADEAVEAALPDSAEEGETWAGWAMQGLLARDRLESARASLERLSRMHDWAKTLYQKLASELLALDRGLKGKARWFVALNARRRAERDRLEASYRVAAWWFSERVDCDELLAVLSGDRKGAGHVDRCEACRRDLEVARNVETKRIRHLSGDDLWRLDLGLATSAERVAARRHASSCTECARALQALDEAESAITGEAPAAAPVAAGRAARKRSEGEVVQHAELRVMLQRRKGRVRLVLQPRRAERIAAASVRVGAGRDIEAVKADEGLEFDLGRESDVEGMTAKVRIELSGGEPLDCDVEL